MGVTKPYEFIGFGAMDVTKPYEFIGFGAMYVTKPYTFIGFGAMAARSITGNAERMETNPDRRRIAATSARNRSESLCAGLWV